MTSNFSPARSVASTYLPEHVSDYRRAPIIDVRKDSERKIGHFLEEIHKTFDSITAASKTEYEEWQITHEQLRKDNQKLGQEITFMETSQFQLEAQLRDVSHLKQLNQEKLDHTSSELQKLQFFQESIMNVTQGNKY